MLAIMDSEAKVLVVGMVVLFTLASALVVLLYERIKVVEGDIRLMKPPVPICPTERIPPPPERINRANGCPGCSAAPGTLHCEDCPTGVTGKYQLRPCQVCGACEGYEHEDSCQMWKLWCEERGWTVKENV